MEIKYEDSNCNFFDEYIREMFRSRLRLHVEEVDFHLGYFSVKYAEVHWNDQDEAHYSASCSPRDDGCVPLFKVSQQWCGLSNLFELSICENRLTTPEFKQFLFCFFLEFLVVGHSVH